MKKGFPIFPILLLGFFILAINAGDTLYEYDKTENNTRDIYNYTESTFVWNMSAYAPIKQVNQSQNESAAIVVRINNIFNKFIDMIGFTAMETGKLGMELGYYGEGSYKLIGLLKMIKWILIIMLLYYLSVPVAAVGIFAWHSYDWIKKKVLRK